MYIYIVYNELIQRQEFVAGTRYILLKSVRERERERERKSKRETERKRETEKERAREVLYKFDI